MALYSTTQQAFLGAAPTVGQNGMTDVIVTPDGAGVLSFAFPSGWTAASKAHKGAVDFMGLANAILAKIQASDPTLDPVSLQYALPLKRTELPAGAMQDWAKNIIAALNAAATDPYKELLSTSGRQLLAALQDMGNTEGLPTDRRIAALELQKNMLNKPSLPAPDKIILRPLILRITSMLDQLYAAVVADQARAQQQAYMQQAAVVPAKTNYLPWAVGGGAALLTLLIMLRK